MPKHTVVRAVLFSIALLSGGGAAAQRFPSGEVRILVGYAPGGGTDGTARVLATRLQARLGVPILVENRPGALGQIAGQYVSRQPGDGKTLLVTSSSPILAAPHLQPLFNPVKELAPVSLLTRVPGVLVVPASSPLKSVSDVVAAAKKDPGKLSYSTSGNGSMNHLAAEMLQKMAGVSMIHVPYSGSAPSLTALLGRHVTMSFAAVQSVMPHIRAGELRALGVDTVERSQVLPDVPSIREAGFPEYGMSNWIGVFAPLATPADLVAQIRGAFIDALKTPEAEKFLSADGQSVVGTTPQEMAREVEREYERIGTLIRSLNLKQQ